MSTSREHDKQPANALLERRIKREREARKSAEQLLLNKTREVYSAHQLTKDAQNLLDMAMWASGEIIWDWCVAKDKLNYRAVRFDSKEVIESSVYFTQFLQSAHPNDRAMLGKQRDDIKRNTRQDIALSIQLKTDQNDFRWKRLKGKAIEFDKEKNPTRVVGTMLDIESSTKSKESNKLMSYVFSQAREAMLILDSDFNIVEANITLRERLSLANADIQNKPVSLLLGLKKNQLQALVANKSIYQESTISYQEKSIPVEVSLNAFSINERTQNFIVCTLKDLTERKLSQNKLYELAHYDSLTNLLNRLALQNAFNQKIEDNPEQKFTVFFIDLDGFKNVNDAMGHEAGDNVLQKISHIIKSCTSPNTMLARWGGDEFVAVCEGDTQSQWEQQAIKFLSGLAEADLGLFDGRYAITASIGIALFPAHGSDVSSVIRSADMAMYEAKLLGKNRWHVYDESITASAVKRITMINELAQAINDNTLMFVLQGKYTSNGDLKAAELLARWTSKSYGVVSPVEFIPLAEQHGLSEKLGLCALRAAARFVKELEHLGKSIPISVNISPMQIISDGFSHTLQSICDEEHTDFKMIELEVTESVFLDDPKLAQKRLRDIQALGFRISLDDFGTGYSSLSYLRQINFDTVKIDRSFVLDVENDKKALNLLTAIVKMCEALEIDTIVEGVETSRQLTLLWGIGLRDFQGYYFGKPLPFSVFLDDNSIGPNKN
jgi:diguanylate cyclase (GGDEF)-like protein/PAS domain S-box-containing protein